MILVSRLQAEDLQQLGGIDKSLLERISSDYAKLGDNKGIVNIVTNNEINALSLNREKLIQHDKLMNFKLKAGGITNQRSSGRCWMFAGLNTVAPDVATRLKTADFELSQPYLTFWDKLEKSNLFLEQIISTGSLPTTDRVVDMLVSDPTGDGGWWNYFSDLIQKYGIVPLTAMPESKQSASTGAINTLINRKLRADAAELRSLHRNGTSIGSLRKKKEAMLAEIYKLLVFSYGNPPTEFTFRYEAKDSTQVLPKKYTPHSFYREYVGGSLPDYVALMDNPNYPYDKVFQLELSRNMADRPDMTVLNLPIDKHKTYALKMLLDSQAVWFACDVGHEHISDSGLLAKDIYDYSGILQTDFSMSKANQLAYGECSPTHAMAFVGVDTVAGSLPAKWLVENSWGTAKGDKGFWYLYNDWFDQYVYVTVIDKKLLSEEDTAKLSQTPILLPMWEPFTTAIRKIGN